MSGMASLDRDRRVAIPRALLGQLERFEWFAQCSERWCWAALWQMLLALTARPPCQCRIAAHLLEMDIDCRCTDDIQYCPAVGPRYRIREDTEARLSQLSLDDQATAVPDLEPGTVANHLNRGKPIVAICELELEDTQHCAIVTGISQLSDVHYLLEFADPYLDQAPGFVSVLWRLPNQIEPLSSWPWEPKRFYFLEEIPTTLDMLKLRPSGQGVETDAQNSRSKDVQKANRAIRRSFTESRYSAEGLLETYLRTLAPARLDPLGIDPSSIRAKESLPELDLDDPPGTSFDRKSVVLRVEDGPAVGTIRFKSPDSQTWFFSDVTLEDSTRLDRGLRDLQAQYPEERPALRLASSKSARTKALLAIGKHGTPLFVPLSAPSLLAEKESRVLDQKEFRGFLLEQLEERIFNAETNLQEHDLDGLRSLSWLRWPEDPGEQSFFEDLEVERWRELEEVTTDEFGLPSEVFLEGDLMGGRFDE